MFDYRLKDVFKSYVDDDDFIFNRINDISIVSNNLKKSFDWNDINGRVYFSLDEDFDYIVNTSNNREYRVYYKYKFKYRNSSTQIYTEQIRCICVDDTINSNTFRWGICTFNNYESGVLGSQFYWSPNNSNVEIIDGKRYVSFYITNSTFLSNYIYRITGTTGDVTDVETIFDYGYNTYINEGTYPWYTSTMDFEYIYSHSGDKLIAPLVYKLLEDDKTITSQNLDKIVNIIKNKYIDKWNKLYQALVVDDYNPIENYSMTEVETPNITKTYHREQNTNIEVSDDGESTSSVYGFNSSTPTPSGKAEVDNTRTTSGNKDDNFQDGNDTETGTREKTRSGNIGVTTTQQMLEQEIEIKKHNFYDIVYGDIDNVIALDIY